MSENLYRIDRHRPKICMNPNFLGYSNSPWTGMNTHRWLYGLNRSEKSSCVSKIPPRYRKKQEITQNNRFSVLLHSRTNRFTFYRFPPPPPLYTLRYRQRQNDIIFKFSTMNFKSIGISMVPEGTVQTKIYSTNQKRLVQIQTCFATLKW